MGELLIEVTRGGVTESMHRGHIVVADGNGCVITGLGNPDRFTYFRSAAKPIILVAVLSTGIADKFSLEPNEIAIMASSHSGQPEHIKTLKSIINKLGISQETLQCGIHAPLHKESEVNLYLSGKTPSTMHCNCSGKHLGILAASIALGMPPEDYYSPGHPIQKRILEIVSHFCRIPPEDIKIAIDGCGLPVYGVPLRNIACAYANLADKSFMEGRYSEFQDMLIEAMVSYPWFVGGDDRLDTVLLKNFGDRLISKTGAEGLHCTGFLGRGTGTALKIDDGNIRAVDPAAIELLHQLGVIRENELDRVKKHRKPAVINHRKEVVGEVRAVFKIPSILGAKP